MAASQVECLEEDNGNTQVSECNPQFVYSERQRLALEALLDQGPGAFYQCIKREGTRLFLSAEEAHRLHASCGDFRHGKVPAGEDGVEAMELDTDSSLTYWPTRSDAQAPFLTLGWPDMGLWKGITRAIVYTHPPMENSPTIKEVIRSLLQKAKQVIAVVMDTFTDVDIFYDLIEGASLRQVAAYILLDQRNLPHFIAMAEGSGTNLRLLNNICVRVLNGSSFCSRNGKKVTGDVKERFLLVDGETVITGSYSFTWSDARLDRNLVTLLTGQVVDAFDREFRTLYAASRPLQQNDFLPPRPLPAMVNGYDLPHVPVRPQALPSPAKPSMLHRVVARRTVTPHPLPPSAGDPARPEAQPTFRQTVTMWRGARGAQGTEAAQALSDILRRARQAASGTSAPPPKASKSMWDLSALSQLSNSSSFGSNSALDHLELGEDARSRLFKTQATPAATLMKHRDALKDEDIPSTSRNPRTFYPSRPLGLASHGNLRRPAPRPWGGVVSRGGRSRTGIGRPAEE